MRNFVFLGLGLLLLAGCCRAEDDVVDEKTVIDDIGKSRDGSKTDDEVVAREEEAIQLDGLNIAQMKELRDRAEKFAFQAEVNRMMKLIINSLYKNKEIFLRELISNASDALDKIRLLSLTDPNALKDKQELIIRIKADKENRVLHITDSGIGMTKNDLVQNLGTIAKSGTAEFLNRVQEAGKQQDTMDMIGQFGVGFYSSFLVADTVVVTTKHNNDSQYVWESDAASFSIAEDPRGSSLERGTQISLHLKEEAGDYLEVETLRNLVKKYSQFINFPIYLWADKTVTVEEPLDEDEKEEPKDEPKDEDEDDAKVEEAKEEKPKTKKVEKTVWEWELLNDHKPIWTRKPNEITDDEYIEFYKALTRDTTNPLAKVHFVAEGEVSFKALVFVPAMQPVESFNKYGTQSDNMKLFVRRVFITDEFELLPKYLAFLRGVVDSDDLPLNVSRETLQQHKLLKVIRKKLVRKALDMIKKLSKEDMDKFWKEYSTNMKLGIIEDPGNRSRLAKILRFASSANDKGTTTLAEYVSRMKPKQDIIYYIAGSSRKEVEQSPFVERLLKRGYEVLYLVEAVDEYCIAALPEFEGKKLQNLAKEGFTLPGSSSLEELKERFKPLTTWLQDNALKGLISKAEVSERLSDSPAALVASMFGWSGNMERLAVSNAHQKSDAVERNYYLNQRKALEINPRHPIIKNLLTRIQFSADDPEAKEAAVMIFRTATLRSGFLLQDTLEFAQSIEGMMRASLGVAENEAVEDDDFVEEEEESAGGEKAQEVDAEEEEHDEL